MKPKYDFKTLYIKEVTKCDNCGKDIFPRTQPMLKDKNYGVVFCLKCWTEYIRTIFKG